MANDVTGPWGAGRGAGEPPRATGRVAPRPVGVRPKFRREMARAAGSVPDEEPEPSDVRWPEGQGLDPVMGLAASARRLGRSAGKPDFPESTTARAKTAGRAASPVRDEGGQAVRRAEGPARRAAEPSRETPADEGADRGAPSGTVEVDAGTRGRGDAQTGGRGDAETESGRGTTPAAAVDLTASQGAAPAPVAGPLVATAAASADAAGPAAAAEAAPDGEAGGTAASVPSPGPDRTTGQDSKVSRVSLTEQAAQATALAEEAPEAERYRGLPAVRLDLEPDDLGRVRLHVALADRRVFATVVTEQEGLRDYLQAQRDRLDADLGRQGLEVGDFLVSTNRRDGGEPSAPGQSRPDRPSSQSEAPDEAPAPLRPDGLNLFA